MSTATLGSDLGKNNIHILGLDGSGSGVVMDGPQKGSSSR